MRRAPFVMGATALGLVAVLSFHSRSPTTTLALPPSTQSQGATGRSGGSPGSSGRQAPPSGTGGTAPPGTTTPTGTTKVPASATPTSQVRTAVGRSEQYGYGVLAVKVTVTGTRITSVVLSQLQTADQYSQQLAVQVIPMLRSQVLAAQTARINGVSGATYTSEAYATSIQSALDKLHVA
ncbi:MAG: FMN-binding protein [Actinomycetota bacterium]|nr:FMN-binding protein [Actinomycetota bacterium]